MMRRTRQEKDARAAAVPRLHVDNAPRCGRTLHVWPVERVPDGVHAFGIPCLCGVRWLVRRADGTIKVIE
jgi:hypothetical protein